MRVTFVNRYFHPDHSATSQLLTDLARHLASRDWTVRIITSRQIYDDPAASLPPRESLEGISIRRLPTSRFGRQNLVGRFFDYLTFHISLWLVLRRADRDEVVIAMTDPPLISVTTAHALGSRGTLVNWIQDLFPEVAEELGVLRKNGIAARAIRRIRNRSLRRAAVNVAVGDAMSRFIAAYGANVTVIRNWADEKEIRPVPMSSSSLRQAWNPEGRFTIGYSGNLGRAHEFDTLLGAMVRLRNSGDRFLIIGGGPRLPALRERVRQEDLESNISFLPYQSRETLSESLGAADVHLVSLRSGLEATIVPSKFAAIAAAGRPTIYIGSRSGDVAQAILLAECGFVVEPGDIDDLVDAIVRLRQDQDLRSVMGMRARRLFEERFDARPALARWRELLGGIADPDRTDSSRR